jgi:hypothetical protein
MPMGVANDHEFWKVTEAQMLQADEHPAPELSGV